MKNKKVCILGAAGAIGSRLVTLLHKQGYEVTAVVRSWSSAVRIGRFDIPLVSLDVLSSSVDRLAEIMKGHDVVIDCTYSSNADYDKRIIESVTLANTICGAATQARVMRLIHYGTISVYPANASTVDETTQCSESGDSYGDSKLAAEQAFLKHNSKSLSITVLQLPIVFGPFMAWSASPVAQMSANELIMPDDLKGFCAPLFVDDVVRATQLSFDCEPSYGERILLSDTSISWGDYYSSYTKHAEALSLAFINRDEFDQRANQALHRLKPFQALKSKFINDGDFRQLILSQWGLRSIYGLAKKLKGQDGIDQIKQKIESSVQPTQAQILLDQKNLQLFDSLPKVNASKASEILGMNDYTDFSKAVLITHDWLKWARLVN